MRRCRTTKNKKWRVQLIQRRPRPALSRTWCILWRFWTQSLTHGPSVTPTPLSVACISFLFSIAHITPMSSSVVVSWLSSCAFCCVSQWNGPVSRRTNQNWAWQTVQWPLSGMVNTRSSLYYVVLWLAEGTHGWGMKEESSIECFYWCCRASCLNMWMTSFPYSRITSCLIYPGFPVISHPSVFPDAIFDCSVEPVMCTCLYVFST